MKRNVTDNSQDYNDAVRNLNVQKNRQRQLIVEELRKARCKDVHGSQGTYHYTSRRRLELPINLGTEKWISGMSPTGNSRFILGLDTIEQDPVTKNIHSLDGRLNLIIIPIAEAPKASDWETSSAYYDWQREHYGCEVYEDPCFSQTVLPFNLPLSEKDRAELVNLILARCETEHNMHA